VAWRARARYGDAMNERALELKVGAVLLAALLVLGGFVLLLGDFSLSGGQRLYVDYAFSGAIQAGAPVKISGVRVGRVEELRFVGGSREVVPPPAGGDEIQTRLVLRLEPHATSALRAGARFFVNTQGLLGEHYVEIVPAAQPGAPLDASTAVRGVDPPRFDLLVQRMYDLMDAATGLMAKGDVPVGDLVRSGASLAKTLDRALAANEADVRRIVVAAAAAVEDAQRASAAVSRAVGDGARLEAIAGDVAGITRRVNEDLPKVLARLDHTLAELEALSGSVDRAELAALVKSARATSAEAELTLRDVRAITQRIRTGGGTVGLLLTDDEVYDDLKEILRDLKQNPWKLVWKQ
jgi:phospholipid/cholesterol/gamma-HCH transport system substrate-binding protein